jgi:hypothetical protein
MIADPRPRVRLAVVRASKDVRKLEAIASSDSLAFVRTAAKVRLWTLRD